jgi:tripartite tricarboxylate transporter TctB family protein
VKGIRERAPVLFSRRSFLIVVVPLFSIVYFVSAVRIYSPPVQLEVSARAFPMIVGVALIISGLIVAVEEFRDSRKQVGEAVDEPLPADSATLEDLTGDELEEVTSWRDFWIAFAAITAMAIFMDEVGFIIASVLLVAGLAIYFERRNIVRNIVVAVAYAAVLFYLFDSVFEIRLPSGPLPW